MSTKSYKGVLLDVISLDSKITTTSGTLQTQIDGISGGGLTYWTEAENQTGINSTVPVTSLTPTTSSGNVDVALVAKGTGAVLGAVPDGTAAGGNKRGDNAIDFQTARALATEVASGAHSVLIGGECNVASGDFSLVVGGGLSSSSWANQATANYAMVIGGYQNVVTAVYSSILGGYSNTISASTSIIAGASSSSIASGSDSSFIGAGANQTVGATSDNAFIGGGSGHSISGMWCTVAGGQSNTITNTAHFSTIGGGYSNECTDTDGRMTIAGGYNNSVGGKGGTICGGEANIINAAKDYSFIGGGYSNLVTGLYGTITGGYDCTAADYATVAGGLGNEANDYYASIVGGAYAKADVRGQQAYASGRFTATGDAQSSKLVLRTNTTTNVPDVLTTSGNVTPTAVNQLYIQDGQAISFIGTATAKQDSSTNIASWKIEGVLVREGTTTTLVASTVTAISNTPGWTLALTANDTLETLAITFTGAASTNIRIVAAIDTSEVLY